MTNSTIDDAKIILHDGWPGEAEYILSEPPDGFTGSGHHNVASPVYEVGKKVKIYDETNKGYAVFMYLQYIAGTKAATLALAAKQLCAIDTSEQATAGTSPTYFKVTDDASEALLQTGMIAVALSAMTTTYYGWFWIGGVCPVGWVPGLNGTYRTDGSVAAGKSLKGVANATKASLYSDAIILALAMTEGGHATTTVADVVPSVGVALIDD